MQPAPVTASSLVSAAAMQFSVRTPGELGGPSGSSMLPAMRLVFNCL